MKAYAAHVDPAAHRADWAASWFDSTCYHQLYGHRDDAEARRFMVNLVRLLGLGRGSTVLDLGCGRGRHAVYLSTTGADVTGIDLAPANIRYARRHEHSSLRFRVGDMREPYGEGCFSEILNLFTSFGYFESHRDNLRVLRHATRALRPGGRLVVDFLNAEKVVRTLVAHEVKQVAGTEFRLHRRVEHGIIVKDIIVSKHGMRRRFQERVQALRLTDFLLYFRHVGLEFEYALGNYDLDPFDADQSDRLILIARKPGVRAAGVRDRTYSFTSRTNSSNAG